MCLCCAHLCMVWINKWKHIKWWHTEHPAWWSSDVWSYLRWPYDWYCHYITSHRVRTSLGSQALGHSAGPNPFNGQLNMNQAKITKSLPINGWLNRLLLKEHYVDILIRREKSLFTYLSCLNKLNKQTPFFSCLNKPNKQTDLKGQHSFIPCYFVYIWRTLPPF